LIILELSAHFSKVLKIGLKSEAENFFQKSMDISSYTSSENVMLFKVSCRESFHI